MRKIEINEEGNWRAFRHLNYRIVFRANAFANIGSWIQRVAQAWLVLELTGSGTYLGFIASLQLAPFLFVTLAGGVVADRFNKRIVLIFTNISFFLTASILGLLVVLNEVRIWHVMLMAFVLGVTDGIDKPVRQSFVSEIVGVKDMPNAISLNSANFNFGRLVGPAVAGILIAAFGTGPAFLINGFSYLFVFSAMLRLKKEKLFHVVKPKGPANLNEGFRYVLKRPDIYVTMLVGFFLATFGLNFELFNALMSTKEFHKGVASFGLLGTIVAVGSFSGALFSPRFERHRSTKFVIIGAGIFSICIMVSSFMPTYFTYAICLPFAGAAALTTVIAANSNTQLNSDPLIRGRVVGIYQFIFLGGTPISSPLIGWACEHFGVRHTITACAALTLLPLILIWFKYKDEIHVPEDISIKAVLRR
ncbi:ProP Permeases of the major facilitator superfamily [Candidatus Nanopelagicaceae bacterium]